MQIAEQIDAIRAEASSKLDPIKRAKLGQFMTPSSTAQFMASLFKNDSYSTARLLDAGAGVGSLTSAFLERCFFKWEKFKQIDVVSYEIDPFLCLYLERNLSYLKMLGRTKGIDVSTIVYTKDFIETTVHEIISNELSKYTHAILNPPYRKINSHSDHRYWLRTAGVETVNLYTAFLALVVDLMVNNGEIVAIVPRSFCNGTYYRLFREHLLYKVSVEQIHLYKARDKAFKESDVLQENIILHLVKGKKQDSVIISTSTDDRLYDYQEYVYPFEQIVKPTDPENFIHIPTAPVSCPIENSQFIIYSLADIGISASTGPVVDFRALPYLRKYPEEKTVPLIYPAHFGVQCVEWPKEDSKKPNAIVQHPNTQKSLYPNGYYTVVRRFSSKEEKRRIVANVVNPATFQSEYLGFENHLNVFHEKKKGLSKEMAYGLFVFLSSTQVDEYFRRFNGHTQVNVGDLKQMKYPSRATLLELGVWAMVQDALTQEIIDKKVIDLA